MKTEEMSFQSKVAKIKVRVNPELNQYDNQVLFPEKLAKANEAIKRLGLPKEWAEKK